MENTEKHIHNFTLIDVPSTCKEHGYTLHKCECGYEHKDNFKPLAPHLFKIVEEKKPTCTEGGVQKLSCSVCSETQVRHLSPLGHDWSPWTIETFATCTENGKQVRFCKRCGAKEETIIKAKGHKLASPQKSTTEKGMLEYYCKNCGETIVVPSKAKKFSIFLSKHRKKFKIAGITVVTLIILGIGASIAKEYILPIYHYSVAQKSIKEQEYLDAYSHLNKCIGYKDSSMLLDDFDVYYETVNETKREFKYDAQGNLTHVYSSDSDGTLILEYEYQYEYNKNGNITNMAYYYHEDGERTLSYEIEYEYNKNGQLLKATRFDDTDETVTTYNKNGTISSIIEYEDGHFYKQTDYHTNGKLKKISGTTYTKTYNKRGRLIDYENDNPSVKFRRNLFTGTSEIRVYDSDDKLIQKESYDKNGNLVERTRYENNKMISRSKGKFDDNNTLISNKIHEKRTHDYYYTYKYDKFGALIFSETTCPELDYKETHVYRNKYDKHGLRTSISYKRTLDSKEKKEKDPPIKHEYKNPVVLYVSGQ